MSSLKLLTQVATNNTPGNIAWSIGSPSDGYLLNDGAILSQTTYAGLYQEVGLIQDGINVWTTRTSGTSSQIRGLIYGNGLYVWGCNSTVLNTARIATSDDGVTWTIRSASINNLGILRLHYQNGLYAFNANEQFATSTDAIIWTTRTTQFGGNQPYGFIYDGTQYVLNGQNGRVSTSTDAITWTLATTVPITSFYDLTYGNGVYVGVGFTSVPSNTGYIATSTDAITWTQQSSQTSSSIFRVLYEATQSIFLATGNAGYLSTSTDGVTWTVRSPGTVVNLGQIIYSTDDAIWMVTGNSGALLTSTNAITWTARTSGTTSTVYSLTYGNGLYLLGTAGTNGQNLRGTTFYTYNTATEFALPIGFNALTDVTVSSYIKGD